MIQLTDHERAFAASPQGASLLGLAERQHRLREDHRGANAIPWTDASKAAAIRHLAKVHARSDLSAAAANAACADSRAALETAAKLAREQRMDRLRNAHRG